MRGASGGGTLCSGELQLLQNSPPDAPARSQWPRAAHSGLMHCTVQPGKYCTFPPCDHAQSFSDAAPLVFCEPKNHREKLPEFCASALVASRAKIQFLVVRLQSGASGQSRFALSLRMAPWKFRAPTVFRQMYVRPLQPFPGCPQSLLPVNGCRANFWKCS
jgi:hypothetical protein